MWQWRVGPEGKHLSAFGMHFINSFNGVKMIHTRIDAVIEHHNARFFCSEI